MTLGGAKGNVLHLRSFDGRFQVEINADDLTTVGPEIHAAGPWSISAFAALVGGVEQPNPRTLVTHSFQTDKKGGRSASAGY